MSDYQHLKRNFGPVYDKNSKILILGTFPSVKSRAVSFYYGHPRNRFWSILAKIYNEEISNGITERQAFLLRNGIALWDTIEECDIIGSSDASIKNVVPIAIMKILNEAKINHIYCNGDTSYRLFMKYLYPICQVTPFKLPSTSPANAAWTFEQLVKAWEVISK